jgi:hypothetical protein
MRTTVDVIDRFNRAFVEHDPAALNDLIVAALGYSKTAGEVPLAAADGEESRA